MTLRRIAVGSWYAHEALPGLGIVLGPDQWIDLYLDGCVVRLSRAVNMPAVDDDLEPHAERDPWLDDIKAAAAEMESALPDPIDDRPIPPILDPLEMAELLDRTFRVVVDIEPETLECESSLNPRPAQKRRRTAMRARGQ